MLRNLFLLLLCIGPCIPLKAQDTLNKYNGVLKEGWWKYCDEQTLTCMFRFYKIKKQALTILESSQTGTTSNDKKEKLISEEKKSFRVFYFADTLHFFKESEIPFNLWGIQPVAPSLVRKDYRLFYQLPAPKEYILGDTLQIKFGIITWKKEALKVRGHSEEIHYDTATLLYSVKLTIRDIWRQHEEQNIPLFVNEELLQIPYALNSFHVVDSAPPKQLVLSEKELHVLRTHFALSEWIDTSGKVVARAPLNSYRSVIPIPEPHMLFRVRFISYTQKKQIEFNLIYRPD